MNAPAYASPSAGLSQPMPTSIWSLLLKMFSLYGEVLLRSGFGERHLTFGSMLLGIAGLLFLPMVLVAVLTFLMSSFMLGTLGGLFAAALTSQLPWTRGTIYFHIFTLWFIARCVWHFIGMDMRCSIGEQQLSTYSGQPNALWKLVPGRLSEETIKRYGEPALMIGLGLFVRQTDLLLTCYWVASGLAMFVKGYWEHLLVTQRLYDIHDQMLEAQALGGNLQGSSRQPGDLRGVALPAQLEQYQPHQARALTSVLQSQAPLAPLPASPTEAHPAAMAATLSPELARLLDQVPLAEDPPVADWVLEPLELPVVEDWFHDEPEPELPLARALDRPVGKDPRPVFRCPHCDQCNRERHGRRALRLRCGNCREWFRLPQTPELATT
ncbi:hypothetical protein GC163_23035 [bacterium]|nr:hypothetical protein [bacterium]